MNLADLMHAHENDPNRPFTYTGTGRLRYLCPQKCGWHFDEPEMNRYVIRPGGSISDAITEVAQARSTAVEEALAAHLAEHQQALKRLAGLPPLGDLPHP